VRDASGVWQDWIGRPFAASHGQQGSRFSKTPGPYQASVTTLPLAEAGAAVIAIGTTCLSRYGVIQIGNAMTMKRGSPGFGPVDV